MVMTDARFPERWLNDRRVLRLSGDAFRLFMFSLAWSVANRTDGVIERDDLALVPGGHMPELAGALVSSGLWLRRGDGWLVASFEETQTTAADLDALARGRRTQRDRQRRYRAHSAGDHSLCAGRPCASEPVTRDSTRDVPRHTPRTGQARPGNTRTGSTSYSSVTNISTDGSGVFPAEPRDDA
jgi:hypothetical protein